MSSRYELSRREKEVLNTNLSAKILKLQFHYHCEEGDISIPERLKTLYSLRDKLCCGKLLLLPETEKVLEEFRSMSPSAKEDLPDAIRYSIEALQNSLK